MASYYAQLDANSMVVQVIAVNDPSIYNADGSDNEAAAQIYLQNHYGVGTNWLHTRYDGSIRKNYAGVGYQYDKVRDAFIAPQPFPSWLLDDKTCTWMPPVAMPIDGKMYIWDEKTQSWIGK